MQIILERLKCSNPVSLFGGLLHSIGKADKCLETRKKVSTGCTEIAQEGRLYFTVLQKE